MGELVRMEGIPGAPPDLANPPERLPLPSALPALHCGRDPELYSLQVGVRPQLVPVALGHSVACHLRTAEIEATHA